VSTYSPGDHVFRRPQTLLTARPVTSGRLEGVSMSSQPEANLYAASPFSDAVLRPRGRRKARQLPADPLRRRRQAGIGCAPGVLTATALWRSAPTAPVYVTSRSGQLRGGSRLAERLRARGDSPAERWPGWRPLSPDPRGSFAVKAAVATNRPGRSLPFGPRRRACNRASRLGIATCSGIVPARATGTVP
jgi:hypothetical protein